eukprot:GHVU01153409.1.p1 GENE.GHVU01153409.1~~GHVU01153409.1.p1  ORF type:complete len:186 (-),score=3.34 GHVU01153409.1:177-734(-)
MVTQSGMSVALSFTSATEWHSYPARGPNGEGGNERRRERGTEGPREGMLGRAARDRDWRPHVAARVWDRACVSVSAERGPPTPRLESCAAQPAVLVYRWVRTYVRTCRHPSFHAPLTLALLLVLFLSIYRDPGYNPMYMQQLVLSPLLPPQTAITKSNATDAASREGWFTVGRPAMTGQTVTLTG